MNHKIKEECKIKTKKSIILRACLNFAFENCYRLVFCQFRRFLQLIAELLSTKKATTSGEKQDITKSMGKF